jgi:hypothetical protein
MDWPVRRRWLWGVGGVLVLTVGFLAAVFLLPPPAPYEFLQGRRPVEDDIPESKRKIIARWGQEHIFYTFKGDFDSLIKRAGLEMKAKGFVAHSGRLSGAALVSYELATPSNITAAASRTRKTPSATYPMIRVFGDTRYRRKTPSLGLDPGWVTVQVIDKPHPSLLDRFHDWLGL